MRNVLYQRLHTSLSLAALAVSFVASHTPAFGQFAGVGGRSPLSRGGDRPGQKGGRPVGFTYYGALLGTYSSGIVPTAVSSEGTLLTLGSYGGAVEGGATGTKSWGRNTFGVDWRGDYRRYNRSGIGGNLNGSDQALSLFFNAQPTRRINYELSVTGLTTNRAVGGFVAPSFLTQELTGLPLNDIIDNRIYALQGSSALGYRLSARSQFYFYGAGYAARRAAKTLIGTNGIGGGAQYARTMSARTTVGGSYYFWHFSFPRAFGASDIHSAVLSIRKQLTRSWQFDASAGAFRAETLGSNTVVLDPAVAEILGITTGVRAVYRIDYAPSLSASLNYRINQRTSCMLSGAYGVTPGNGLYLTSKVETESFGCSTDLPRRASISLSAGRSVYRSLYQDDLGRFSSYQAGGGMNYRLRSHLNFVAQADVRTFSITKGSSRTGVTATIGIALSPLDSPLPRW